MVTLAMTFSSESLFTNQAPWFQALSRLVPLTYLLDLIRANARGDGSGRLVNLGAVIAWLIACGYLALWLAYRRVEEK